MITKCLVLFCILAVTSAIMHRPSYIVPCSISQDFERCAMQHALDAIPYLLKGNRKLGLPTFTPLEISKIEIKGANDFKITLENIKVYGLENTKPIKFNFDFEKRTAQFFTTVPSLVVVGDYTMVGKILIFNLNGHGPANLTLKGGEYEYDFHWNIENRDGVEFGKLFNSSFDYKLSQVEYNFDNVINGDKALSDQINKILNQNWKIVNEDLKDSVRHVLLLIHNHMFKLIFEQIPFRELFID